MKIDLNVHPEIWFEIIPIWKVNDFLLSLKLKSKTFDLATFLASLDFTKGDLTKTKYRLIHPKNHSDLLCHVTLHISNITSYMYFLF